MPITHLDVRGHLVDALRCDLTGPMLPDELIEQRPTRWYLTGFLVPKGAPIEQRSDPLEDESFGTGYSSDNDDDGSDDNGPAAPAWFPSSFGLSVFVHAETPTLTITASWGEYRLLDPATSLAAWQEFQPERLAAIQRSREEAVDGAVAPEGTPDGDESQTKKRVRPPSPLWRRTAQTATVEVPLQSGSYKLGGPHAAGLRLHLQVRPALSPGLSSDTMAVAVFLVNEREPIDGAKADERALFQTELRVASPTGFVPRTDWSGMDSGDDDVKRADLQYRNHQEWAVGHGVATEPESDDMTAPGARVRTAWIPGAKVRRMEAVAVPGVSLEMEAIAALPDAVALATAVQPMLDEYTKWLADRKSESASLLAERASTAAGLLARAAKVRDRIRDGITWLAANPDAFRAFQLTNLAMHESALRGNPDRYKTTKPKWRLFQLAFLLLNVQSVGDGGHPDREVVELLFFPTGGGKTEAYLGVAAFTMLLRRLRGTGRPDEGAGVTVLLRYTLRLLTLDQLGRAATLICALEMLRRADPKRLGSRRFSIGLWVGRSGTANKMVDAERELSLYRSNPKDPRRSPGVPLPACPWCRQPFVPDCFGIEKRDSKPWALRVGCVDPECAFHRDNSDNIGVPVAVVDEQVYRELPTFLLATVDKFAVLPWRGQAGTLFGKVTAGDVHGFYAPGEVVPSNARRLPEGILPPELIIQDELHLITGPLGTMVGLYETVVNHFCRRADGVGPKILASTATARRAGHQIQALYGRNIVELFPPPGLDPGDTFFARTDTTEQATRLYVGVAAPGRSIKAITVRVFSTLLAAAYKDWHRNPGGIDNPGDTYATMVSYFNTLRDLGGAQRLVQEEVSPRASRMETRHAIQEKTSPWCRSRNLNYDVLELTSRHSTDDIRKTTTKLRAAYGTPEGGKNDVLLASSMISVGVDIPRLGLMVMMGQPRTVAEYIQATSRVGRETPGLVVTIHNLRRPRDRSHYERFVAFHDGFYRMVEAASVTPFSSRAIDRGLAGVVVALARHGYRPLTPNRAIEKIDTVPGVPNQVANVITSRAQVHANGVPAAALNHLQQRVQSLFSDWSAIVNALAGVGAPIVYSPWEQTTGSIKLLSTAVDPPDPSDARLVKFRAPTSMRDVEPGVHLWVERTIGGEEA